MSGLHVDHMLKHLHLMINIILWKIPVLLRQHNGVDTHSTNRAFCFGRMLDPIADKLLVASCLLMLAADNSIHGWTLWAAIVILCREILVSGLREYLAALRVSVPVTKLAKWKTTVQLVAIGFLIAGEAGDMVLPWTSQIGITLLWISALVTLYTGWDYFRAGVHHIMSE